MPAFLRSALFWKWIFATWFVLLWILSSLSHPGPDIKIENFDKVEHCFFFFCGALAFGLALSLRKSIPRHTWIMVILVGSAIGWLDEYHQTFTPGRSGLDVYDWLADFTGSTLAALSLRVIRKFLLSHTKAN